MLLYACKPRRRSTQYLRHQWAGNGRPDAQQARVPMRAMNSAFPVTQFKKWSATLVANVLSTYALDTVSTVAGVLLVASGLFAGGGLQFVLVMLGCSYVLWGAGLSSSLQA